MFILAATFIALALIFYTIGVWTEKKEGCLKSRHLLLFWIGLILDTSGTTIMIKMANGKLNMHGITGLVAIVIMSIHVLWATIVQIRNDISMKKKFHRFSVLAWCIWMIPFVIEMIYGMSAKSS